MFDVDGWTRALAPLKPNLPYPGAIRKHRQPPYNFWCPRLVILHMLRCPHPSKSTLKNGRIFGNDFAHTGSFELLKGYAGSDMWHVVRADQPRFCFLCSFWFWCFFLCVFFVVFACLFFVFVFFVFCSTFTRRGCDLHVFRFIGPLLHYSW